MSKIYFKFYLSAFIKVYLLFNLFLCTFVKGAPNHVNYENLFSNNDYYNTVNKNSMYLEQRTNNEQVSFSNGQSSISSDRSSNQQSLLITSNKNSENFKQVNFHARQTDPDKFYFPEQEEDDNDKDSNILDRFSVDEKLCFAQEHVFYNNSCHELLKSDSCKEGEWLVLDEKSAKEGFRKIIPKCENRICEYFEFYWPPSKKCYNFSAESDKLLCPSGNEIKFNFFGYGSCVCKPAHVLHNNDDVCYKLYTQGTCSDGYIITENNGTITCSKNPCTNSSLVMWENGDKKCYELGVKGPCKKNFVFNVSVDTKKPDCVNQISFLTVFQPRPFCEIDSSGSCVSGAKVSPIPAEQFIRHVFMGGKKKDRKRKK